GEGPGDFNGIANLTTRPREPNAVWGYDSQLRRLTRLASDSIVIKPVTLTTPGSMMALSMYWLTRDKLLAIGDADSNRLVIADTAGHVLRMATGELLGGDSVSFASRRAISTGFLVCIQPATRRIAMLFVGAGRIDIYDSTARLQAHADVPFPSNGEFDRDQSGRWHARYTWRYYADCSASPTRLYALFAGNRTDGPGGGRSIDARFVHVFDWSGRRIVVIELDHAISTMVTSGDTVLYGMGADVPGLFRFRLPAPTP
ncbi:MAG: hypothetical protein ACREL5_12705, partial [Gemmatimonadales bacterium]